MLDSLTMKFQLLKFQSKHISLTKH